MSYFYEGAGRREALDAIRQSVCDGVRLVTITGQAGSGRTALLHYYIEESRLQDKVSIALVTGNVLLGQSECAEIIRCALLKTVNTKRSNMEPEGLQPDAALLVEISRLRDAGILPVVFFDDAHEVQPDVLSSLLMCCRVAGVTLVLTGDDALAARTGEGPLIPLRALELDECVDFIAGWAESVGRPGIVPSRGHMRRIHRASAGMPGRILSYLEEHSDSTRIDLRIAGVPLGHILFMGLAVGGLIWLLIDATSRQSLPGREGASPVEVPLVLPDGSGLTLPGDRPVLRRPSSMAAVPQPIDVTPRAPPPPIALDVPGEEDVPLAPLASVNEQVSSAARFTADEEFLMKARPSRHTLQLFASFNEASVRNFIARHVSLSCRIFRTTRDDLPWFVVVSGDFRGKDDAREAISRLPVDVQHLKPWPRSFQGIQDELRRRQD